MTSRRGKGLVISLPTLIVSFFLGAITLLSVNIASFIFTEIGLPFSPTILPLPTTLAGWFGMGISLVAIGAINLWLGNVAEEEIRERVKG